MAQAKTKSRASSKAGNSAKAGNSTRRASSKSRKPPATAKPRVAQVAESTAKDAGKSAKDAGRVVGSAAKKARVPLLAGGAALAGAAGGVALGAHHAHRHKGLRLGRTISRVDADDVVHAAKRVGEVGAQIGRVAGELQRSSNGSDAAHRSPVEVVLDGLTARRPRR
jgi:hypothetical protein